MRSNQCLFTWKLTFAAHNSAIIKSQLMQVIKMMAYSPLPRPWTMVDVIEDRLKIALKHNCRYFHFFMLIHLRLLLLLLFLKATFKIWSTAHKTNKKAWKCFLIIFFITHADTVGELKKGIKACQMKIIIFSLMSLNVDFYLYMHNMEMNIVCK
jgi:hypothetical protein